MTTYLSSLFYTHIFIHIGHDDSVIHVTVSFLCSGDIFMVNCDQRNYAESVAYCADQGMLIASIHSDEEYQTVWDMLECNVYIGAESYGTGEWSWSDGSDWDYVAPNTDGITGVGEHHIAMLTDGVWHDWGTGDSLHGVLCRETSGEEPEPEGTV